MGVPFQWENALHCCCQPGLCHIANYYATEMCYTSGYCKTMERKSTDLNTYRRLCVLTTTAKLQSNSPWNFVDTNTAYTKAQTLKTLQLFSDILLLSGCPDN